MNDSKIHPKTLYVSILRTDLEAINADREALRAEVARLKAQVQSAGSPPEGMANR